MPDRNEDDEPASLDRQEGLRPRWTQDEAIAVACARDYLAELQAVYSTALDVLASSPYSDRAHVDWLHNELALIQQQRRDLTVRDQVAIAKIRATFQSRLVAVRPGSSRGRTAHSEDEG